MTISLTEKELECLTTIIKSTQKFIDGAASKALQHKQINEYYAFADYLFLLQELERKLLAAKDTSRCES